MSRCDCRAGRHVPRGLAAGAFGARRAGAARSQRGGREAWQLEIGPDDLRMDEAGGPAPAGGRCGAPGRARSPSSPSTRRAGPRVFTWLRCRSGPAGSRTTARPASRAATCWCRTTCGRSCSPGLSADEFRFLTRTAVLERMSGAALRRGARGERLGDVAGVAGPLEPVPRAARRGWRVVPLSPPLPGAAPFRAVAGRAGSGARRCWREQRIGARRTGTPERRSGTHIRPATSTAWRAGRALRSARLPERPRERPSSAGFDWLEGTGHSSKTRGGRRARLAAGHARGPAGGG